MGGEWEADLLIRRLLDDGRVEVLLVLTGVIFTPSGSVVAATLAVDVKDGLRFLELLVLEPAVLAEVSLFDFVPVAIPTVGTGGIAHGSPKNWNSSSKRSF